MKIAHGFYGNVRCRAAGEAKLARRDAAESYATELVLRGQLEAGAVAALQKLAVAQGGRAAHDGTHRVQHAPCREVVCVGYLRHAGRFLMALRCHDACALKAELHARIGVYRVVYAAVAGDVAAGHAGVRRVHYAVGGQRRDVALPEIECPARRASNPLHALHAALDEPRLQILVLHGEEVRAYRPPARARS